jgi:hypothetical protein
MLCNIHPVSGFVPSGSEVCIEVRENYPIALFFQNRVLSVKSDYSVLIFISLGVVCECDLTAFIQQLRGSPRPLPLYKKCKIHRLWVMCVLYVVILDHGDMWTMFNCSKSVWMIIDNCAKRNEHMHANDLLMCHINPTRDLIRPLAAWNIWHIGTMSRKDFSVWRSF